MEAVNRVYRLVAVDPNFELKAIATAQQSSLVELLKKSWLLFQLPCIFCKLLDQFSSHFIHPSLRLRFCNRYGRFDHFLTLQWSWSEIVRQTCPLLLRILPTSPTEHEHSLVLVISKKGFFCCASCHYLTRILPVPFIYGNSSTLRMKLCVSGTRALIAQLAADAGRRTTLPRIEKNSFPKSMSIEEKNWKARMKQSSFRYRNWINIKKGSLHKETDVQTSEVYGLKNGKIWP